jgi:hypothetical protein
MFRRTVEIETLLPAHGEKVPKADEGSLLRFAIRSKIFECSSSKCARMRRYAERLLEGRSAQFQARGYFDVLRRAAPAQDDTGIHGISMRLRASATPTS